jgi:Ca2+-binding EF-hand superfamily protein
MAEMGERLSAGEIAEMMLTHDLDSDGLISFEVSAVADNC